MSARRKYHIRFIAIVVVLAALIAVLFGERVVRAQGSDDDHVDVGLALEAIKREHPGSRHLKIVVVNHGVRTAYDVEVVVSIVYPKNLSYFSSIIDVPIGRESLENDRRSLRWTIDKLGGLQREEVTVSVFHKRSGVNAFDAREYVHAYVGEATTSSFESDSRKGNNYTRIWSSLTNQRDSANNQAASDFTVAVSVDEHSPSSGDTVNFTITAKQLTDRFNRYAVIDQQVAIELTDGLTVDGSPTYDPATRASSVAYNDGTFNIGTLKFSDWKREHSVTLPVRVADDAVVNDQCLTATITGNPPPGAGPYDDDISDNVASLCLGVPPEQVFQDGTVAVWTLHACRSSVADNACDTAAEVDVRVLTSIDGNIRDVSPVIHVKDEPGRVFDADGGSVTNGTTVSWQTATDEDPDFTGTRSGVKVGFVRSPINNYLENWTHYQVTYTASRLDGGPPPGKISVRSRTTGTALWALDSGNSWTFKRSTNYSLSSASTATTVRLVEFEKLGTYLLDFTADLTHATLTGPSVFRGTGRTIFHVGPIAELGVSDGGPSGDATTEQVAFTVVGINNRNEDAENGKIVVELPAGTAGLTTVPVNVGTFDRSANPPTWTWDIHDLELGDRRKSRGLPESVSVTLVVEAVTAGKTATAKVVYDPYEVCIGSDGSTLAHTTEATCVADTASGGTWHEGTVYDYNTDNNTATITARAGWDGDDGPTWQTPAIHAPAVGLEWNEIRFLYGLPVKGYEIQWSTNGVSGWTQLETDLPLEVLVDTTIQSGITRFYRVRAINEAGVHGPWSQPIIARTGTTSAPGAPTGVSASPDGDTAIDVSWTAPLDDGGTPITRYDVQWSPDGSSNWRTAGNTPDGATLTFKNSGMTFGTTRYYRVAARNSRGLGPWSDPPYASATTLSGVPGQPRLTVRATDANTIALTWTKPADNGDPITRYEIQWSEDGSSGWTQLATPGPSDTSYDDAGLDPGTRRYYRLRARNGIGNGSWSRTVNALTPPAMPSAPTLYAASDGENAINLSWDPPADDGGADITGYELHVSINSGVNYSRLTSLSATARSYVHRGLKPGDERYYQLRARNRAGWGEFSGSASAVTLTGVPTAPGLTARANGSTEIRLTWTDPDDRGSDITNYDLQQSDDGEDWHSLGGVIPADDLEYLHSGLSGGTRKYYRIRAVNGNGEGQWSATRNARTDAGGPDAPVLSLSVASDNQIDLTWTVPADNGSRIRGYWVERSVDGSAPWERLRSSGTSTTYSDDSLYRGMTRYYRVAATNSAGAGAYSNVASATTTGDPATAPSAPTFCRLSDVNRNQVSLAWDPPADDGGAPVSGYEYRVTYPGVDGSTQRVEGTTSSTSARISGLTSDGSYLFRVRAVNPVGKGEWSSDILATLWPSLSGSVRVSPTTITVDEGDTVSYTIRLGTAPPHPVEVLISTQGFEGAADIEDAASAYSGRVLIPSGWTHPGDEDWSGFTHNWSRGVPVTFTAPEDSDNADDVTVIDHYVIAVPYDNYYPCQDAADVEKCSDDWDAAWTKSPYQSLTGASVKITVRDND